METSVADKGNRLWGAISNWQLAISEPKATAKTQPQINAKERESRTNTRHPSASSTPLEGRLRRRNSMLNLSPSAKVSGEKVLGFDLSWENIAVQSSLAYKVYMDQEDRLTLHPAAFV